MGSEWISFLGWVVPLAFFAVVFVRAARRVDSLAASFEDPEALAQALRVALEEAHDRAALPPLGDAAIRVEVVSNIASRRGLPRGAERALRNPSEIAASASDPVPFPPYQSESRAGVHALLAAVGAVIAGFAFLLR